MKRIQRSIERLESRHLMASDWQNQLLVCDVDNSSLVTPLDALVVINAINANGPLGQLTQRIDELRKRPSYA